MPDLFQGVNANGTSSRFHRGAPGGTRLGLFMWKKTGAGTGTLSLYNGYNDALLTDPIVFGTATAGSQVSLLIPPTFYAVITGTSGSPGISAAIDGADY